MFPSSSDIVALHDAVLASRADTPLDAAHGRPPSAPASAAADAAKAPAALLEAAHLANLAIWQLEDEARRRDLPDERIAAIKRAIDVWNQRRNDLMEEIDTTVLDGFSKIDCSRAELHSETAGMIIDRLSILALKIRNMDAVAADARAQCDAALEGECIRRAGLLRRQREELAGCLARLFEDFTAGRRCFRSYRQLKSYNDPRMNRALRAAARGPGFEAGSR